MARILVVDDDGDILKLVERVFAPGGHAVVTTADAYQAMDRLEHIDFDLLISDWNMPHFSGIELVQTLRKNPRYQSLSIAMLTGLRERKDIERALKAGVDDYIVKPIDPLILMQKVTTLFSKKQPAQHPEAVFQVQDPLGQALVKTPFRMESVSELGAVVIAPFPLSLGQVLDINGPFFEQLGVEPPPMRVLSSDVLENGECRAHLIFLGAREAFLQRIRRWIFSHGSSARVGA